MFLFSTPNLGQEDSATNKESEGLRLSKAGRKDPMEVRGDREGTLPGTGEGTGDNISPTGETWPTPGSCKKHE